MSLIKSKQAFALIEVILAMGIGIVVLAGAVSLSTRNVSVATNNAIQQEASKVLSQQVDLIRSYRDSFLTWDAFVSAISGCTSACYISSSVTTINVNSGNGTSTLGTQVFQYGFIITNTAGGMLNTTDKIARVTATATWQYRGVSKSTETVFELTSWRDYE